MKRRKMNRMLQPIPLVAVLVDPGDLKHRRGQPIIVMITSLRMMEVARKLSRHGFTLHLTYTTRLLLLFQIGG
jgi:hypothetical protein